MKNTIYWIIGGLAVGAVVLLVMQKPEQSETVTPLSNEQQVRSVVEEFGSRMKNISLLSPQAASDIRAQYEGLISEEILTAWEQDPTKAPGRLTSSPWPERIEILEVEEQEDGAYEVQGRVIEVTSAENGSENIASQYTIALKLRNRSEKWIITGYQSTKAVQ